MSHKQDVVAAVHELQKLANEMPRKPHQNAMRESLQAEIALLRTALDLEGFVVRRGFEIDHAA